MAQSYFQVYLAIVIMTCSWHVGGQGGASSSSGGGAGSSSGGASGSVGGSASVGGGGSAGSSGGGSAGNSVDGSDWAGNSDSAGSSGGSSGAAGVPPGGLAIGEIPSGSPPHTGPVFRNPACWMNVMEAKSQYMGPQGSETSTATYASRHCNKDGCKNVIGRFHLRDDLIATNKNVQLLYYPPGSMKWVRRGQHAARDIPLEFEGQQMLCRFVNNNTNTVIGIAMKGPGAKKECRAKVDPNEAAKTSTTYEVLFFKGCANSGVNNPVPKNCTSLPGCPTIELAEAGQGSDTSGDAIILH